MSCIEVFFGKPLKSEEEQTEQLSTVSAIPVVGLDALASAAYGPEAALTVLLVLGNPGSRYIAPIAGCIIVLLLLVALSYRQTIPAYPQGGGSFTVAKDNLGIFSGLIAGTALCIDYVLNVAVAISAGVAALVSALPPLFPYTLELSLAILVLLAVLNLRGIRSAGLLLLLPTYLFIGCLGATMVIGAFKVILAQGHVTPIQPPPRIPASVGAAGPWLLVRAFASGCTALTGVEAVSNAVPIFREPAADRAKRTLSIIMATLAALIAGVATLVPAYGISATVPGQVGYQSVLSQVVAAVFGRGVFYYVTIGSILSVLLLSANTSFTDFPRVCRLLALDEFLPSEFALRGRRLVYSNGIVALSFFSGALLVAFGGITDRLIPLFAVGAFSAFTLSQLGMVQHWRRNHGRGTKWPTLMNGVGAAATCITLVIVAIAKFAEGAWLTLLVIPSMLFIFVRIRRYNEWVDREIDEADVSVDVSDIPTPVVVVPLKRLNRVTRKALRLALSLGKEIYAVQVVAEELNSDDLTQRWSSLVEEPARRASQPVPKLVVIRSPYRQFFGPLLHYVEKLAAQHKDRPVAVIIPELVEKRWYNFLFRHRATVLKELLLVRGGPQIIIINTPLYLGRKDRFEG